MNLSTAEPDDFEGKICFPDCPANMDAESICECDAIELDLRDAFAEMTRECY